MINNLTNHKEWLKKDKKDWKILISLDLFVSIFLFAISLNFNNDDLIYIGLEGIVLFFNIPTLISSSRY